MPLTTSHFGVDIPVIGFGTWQLLDDVAQSCVSKAIEAGYRMIDTAQIYQNEAAVGRGMKDAQVPRDDLWVTTKIWISAFRDGDLQASMAQSLERLDLDQVDLTLLHWPSKDVPLDETIAALNEIRTAGLTRHIGVSNFPTRLMRQAVELSPAPIITNQVEYHPFLDQTQILDAAQASGMSVTAFSPLARGRVFDDPVLLRIGQRYGKSPAQISMRWLVQQPGIIAIPRSSSVAHLASNIDVFDFELTDEEMSEISSLGKQGIRLSNPSIAPDWDTPV